MTSQEKTVGPVVEANAVGRAIAAAICEAHAGARVIDRGAYLRVLVPGACRVSRAAIERALGAPFVLPGDLELVMSAYKGVLAIDDAEVAWS